MAFLYVSDRDRALAFYERLGCSLHSSDAHGDFLDLGGAWLRMTVVANHHSGPHPVLGWTIPDIRAAAKALRARGVDFTFYEGMAQDELGIWTSPDGTGKVAFFSDPDGNVLSLTEL